MKVKIPTHIIPFKKFSNVKYDNFQKLLKEIVKIEKKSDDGTEIEDIILKAKGWYYKYLKLGATPFYSLCRTFEML